MERTSSLNRPKYTAVAHHTEPGLDNVAPLDDYLRSLKPWGQAGPTGKTLCLKVSPDGVAHVSAQHGFLPRSARHDEARAMTDFLYRLGHRLLTAPDRSPALEPAARGLYDLANNPVPNGRIEDTQALRDRVRQLREAIEALRPGTADDPLVGLDASSHGASEAAAETSAPPPVDPPGPGADLRRGTSFSLSALLKRQAGYTPLDGARADTDRSDRESRERRTTKPATEKTRLIDSCD